MVGDANNLAAVLAFSDADLQTFGAPVWQDAGGNLYSAACFEADATWTQGAQSTLVRPVWDASPYQINMAGAGRAQVALAVWMTGDPQPVTQADPAHLTVIGGPEGLAALTMAGVGPIPEPGATIQ